MAKEGRRRCLSEVRHTNDGPHSDGYTTSLLTLISNSSSKNGGLRATRCTCTTVACVRVTLYYVVTKPRPGLRAW